MIMHQNKKVTLYCKVCTGAEDEERRIEEGRVEEGRMGGEDEEGRIRREVKREG